MAQDKLLYLLAGIAVAAVACPFGPAAAMLAVFVLAIAKELWDSNRHGKSDALDAMATIGGGFGLLFWYEIFKR